MIIFFRLFAVGLAVAGVSSLLYAGSSHAQAPAAPPSELVVGSIGGFLDETLKRVSVPFERKHNVKIRWVPGISAEKLAKVEASKANPEFDVVMIDDPFQILGSTRGLWEKIDRSVVTHYNDLYPQAKARNDDGVGIGFFFAGIFYRTDEFEKHHWAPPQSWNDLFRPEFCGKLGIPHPHFAYGIQLLLMLAGGNPDRIDEGIAKLATLKNCIAVLEPSAPKLEEKIQLGEYVIGVHGNIRVIPLTKKGIPVRFVFPREGSINAVTMLAPVKNARNGRMAQELANWLIAPEIQKELVEALYYGPANSKLRVTKEMRDLGVPDAEMMSRLHNVTASGDMENRRSWVRKTERAMAR